MMMKTAQPVAAKASRRTTVVVQARRTAKPAKTSRASTPDSAW